MSKKEVVEGSDEEDEDGGGLFFFFLGMFTYDVPQEKLGNKPNCKVGD